MSWSAPGVIFSEKEMLQPALEDATAVPVFVGFSTAAAGTMKVFASWASLLESGLMNNAAWMDSPLAVALRLYFDNGGTQAWVLSAGAVPADDGAIGAALQAAVRSEALTVQVQITLLCVPDVTRLQSTAAGTEWVQVWQAMLEVAQQRRACFALLDLPSEAASASALIGNVSTLAHTEFGAAYWPHLETRYRADDSWISAVPSGAIAAAIQQTDGTRGVWKAPANIALQQVVRPRYVLAQGMQVFQQPAQVNLIRSFPGRGVRVWGCRTLVASETSPWRFIQVRRLLSTIESRLGALCRFSVFEPNNEVTWLKLKSMCRNSLRTMWLNGALFGSSEEEAFRIHVGLDESMTREDILAGCLILKVEVAALYPAQFIGVSLRFNLMEAQLQSAGGQA